MIKKSTYETPAIEVAEIQAEGVLCMSGEGFIDGYDEIIDLFEE